MQGTAGDDSGNSGFSLTAHTTKARAVFLASVQSTWNLVLLAAVVVISTKVVLPRVVTPR
jgi:hypothetical protein